jgi:hypothetical protein
LDGIARAHIDSPIELFEMAEVDDRSDNSGESASVVIEPARKYEGGAAHGTSDEGLAHEQPRGRAVSLCDEVRAVGHIVIRGCGTA